MAALRHVSENLAKHKEVQNRGMVLLLNRWIQVMQTISLKISDEFEPSAFFSVEEDFNHSSQSHYRVFLLNFFLATET